MNRSYYFLLPLVLCLALVWAIAPITGNTENLSNSNVMPQSISRQTKSDNPALQSSPDAAVYAGAENVKPEKEVYMTAKEYNGKLCLFTPDNDIYPSIILDVNMAGLPKSDRDMFSIGVKLYSQKEVTRLIEDYTS